MTLYDIETPTVFKELCEDNSLEDIPARATWSLSILNANSASMTLRFFGLFNSKFLIF